MPVPSYLILSYKSNGMRKETQQKIMVGFIIATFVLSSVAFVTTGFFATNNQNNQQDEFKPPESFVIEGEIDESTEQEYLRRGYTTLKLYSGKEFPYIDQLPEITRTANGQTQLLVQKISSNETYAVIIGPYGENRVDDVAQGEIFSALCESLLVTPVECGLFNITSYSNPEE